MSPLPQGWRGRRGRLELLVCIRFAVRCSFRAMFAEVRVRSTAGALASGGPDGHEDYSQEQTGNDHEESHDDRRVHIVCRISQDV